MSCVSFCSDAPQSINFQLWLHLMIRKIHYHLEEGTSLSLPQCWLIQTRPLSAILLGQGYIAGGPYILKHAGCRKASIIAAKRRLNHVFARDFYHHVASYLEICCCWVNVTAYFLYSEQLSLLMLLGLRDRFYLMNWLISISEQPSQYFESTMHSGFQFSWTS